MAKKRSTKKATKVEKTHRHSMFVVSLVIFGLIIVALFTLHLEYVSSNEYLVGSAIENSVVYLEDNSTEFIDELNQTPKSAEQFFLDNADGSWVKIKLE